MRGVKTPPEYIWQRQILQSMHTELYDETLFERDNLKNIKRKQNSMDALHNGKQLGQGLRRLAMLVSRTEIISNARNAFTPTLIWRTKIYFEELYFF